MDKELLDAYREQYDKSHEQIVLDWVERVNLEHVIFYPQGNPTILLVWIQPDSHEHFLFREIDIVVEGDSIYRVSGGATYHEPTYRLAWLPQQYVRLEDLDATLTNIKAQVDALEFNDLVDMDAYLSTLEIRLDA
jgi:hypothetical protein